MFHASALPLAWRKLTHNKPRLVLSAAGITFAVVLMYVKVGFLNAMRDAQIQILQLLNADLIIHSRAQHAMLTGKPFARRRLAQAKGVDGVVAAYPLYVDFETALWKNAADGTRQPIRVLAFDPNDPVFLAPEIQQAAELLKLPDTALVDIRSRESYGMAMAGSGDPATTGVTTEISGRSIRVVGTFEIGNDFLSDGNVIMSDKNYLEYLAARPKSAPEALQSMVPAASADSTRQMLLTRVHLGLIKVTPDAEPEAVAAALRVALPDDVTVQTKQQFIAQEITYWSESTPLGYVFGLGAALGFVVGVIICYQILFMGVVDNLPQFATLKALGYHNSFLIRVVLTEALVLALLGFLPGLLISQGLYAAVAALTGLPMRFTLGWIGVVFLLTVGMCIVSGFLAIRSVLRADPAEVF